jgi:hypothetical protein
VLADNLECGLNAMWNLAKSSLASCDNGAIMEAVTIIWKLVCEASLVAVAIECLWLSLLNLIYIETITSKANTVNT